MIGTKTPWSSSHATPSITGRSGSLTVPAPKGAFTVKVNVATAPGATDASFCTATRLAESQPEFRPSAVKETSSLRTPSATWVPAVHFVQVFVPVLRKLTVTWDVAAGCRSGTLV